jgi:hypothetical protein
MYSPHSPKEIEDIFGFYKRHIWVSKILAVIMFVLFLSALIRYFRPCV